MPLPDTSNVGSLVDFLKGDKPNMSKKQRVAIALNEARKNGANIPRPSLAEKLK